MSIKALRTQLSVSEFPAETDVSGYFYDTVYRHTEAQI